MFNYHFNKLDKPFIIAIDGPGGSGKSTLGKTIARYLDFSFLDTGKIYRLLTLFYYNEGIDLNNVSIKILKQKLPFFLQNFYLKKEQFYFRNQIIHDNEIYNVLIDRLLPLLVNFPFVREIVVKFSQQCIKNQNYVLVGRDTTTVIAPFADVKFFLDASISKRVERKFLFLLLEQQKNNSNDTFSYREERISYDLKRRDINDKTRKTGPLKFTLDTFFISNEINNSQVALAQMLKIIYIKMDKQLLGSISCRADFKVNDNILASF